MKINYLSHTQVVMWLRCHRQYKFRYVEQLKMPPMIPLGNCYHKAMEHNFRQKIATRIDLPVEEIQGVLGSQWDVLAADPDIDWGEDKPGEIKDQGYGLVKMYMAGNPEKKIDPIAPKVQPLLVEHRFRIETDRTPPMEGYIDIVEEGESNLIDHKTSGKSWSENAAQDETQQYPYLLWLAKETGKTLEELFFNWHIAVKTKVPKIQILQTQVQEYQMNWYLELVAGVAEAIEREIFPPTGIGSWVCSERWCGYWRLCRGEKKPIHAIPFAKVAVQEEGLEDDF